ncbi:MAG: V4R domain-containing protein [bacterium]
MHRASRRRDFSAFPLKVTLHNSQEARWVGPSPTPVCHFYTGIVAGYASTISGESLQATEVTCRATGAPTCVFELQRVETRSRDPGAHDRNEKGPVVSRWCGRAGVRASRLSRRRGRAGDRD